MPAQKTNKKHEVWVFLAFLFVSFSLWLMKVTNEEFETTIPVGVTVRNLPSELELADDDIEIEVGVRARGSKLLAYKLWKECNVAVSYSDFNDNDGALSMPTSQLAHNIEGSLPAFFSFKYFADDSLLLRIKKQTVTLPVEFKPVIVAGTNVEYHGFELNVDSVSVTAPPSMLKNMTHLLFEADSLVTVSKDTLIECVLPRKKYVTYEPSVLVADVKAVPYKRAFFKRKLQLVDVPEKGAGNIVGLPDTVTVSCMLSPRMLANIKNEHFGVYASLNDVVKGERDTLRLKVASLPPFVKRENVRVEPEYVLLGKKWSFNLIGIFK